MKCPLCHKAATVTIGKKNSEGFSKETVMCKHCGYRRAKMVRTVPLALLRRAKMWNPNQPIGKGAKAKDLLQPFDKAGNLSYEFLETYGDKALGKQAKEQAKRQFG